MLLSSRPSGQPCIETKEFNLLRNMLIAAVEERYIDAGLLSFDLFACLSICRIWKSLSLSLSLVSEGGVVSKLKRANVLEFKL